MFQCCPIICVQYMSWVSRSYIWCKRHSDVYRLRIGPQYVSWLVMAVQRVNESEQEMLFLQVRRLHINIMEKIHAGSYFSISKSRDQLYSSHCSHGPYMEKVHLCNNLVLVSCLRFVSFWFPFKIQVSGFPGFKMPPRQDSSIRMSHLRAGAPPGGFIGILKVEIMLNTVRVFYVLIMMTVW